MDMLRYADDIVMISKNITWKYIQKDDSLKRGQPGSIVIVSKKCKLENTDILKYMASTITKARRSKKEIQKIQQVKIAFYEKKQLLTSLNRC